MRNVFVASAITDAGLVQGLLRQNGIESQLVSKTRGNIGVPYTEVWVYGDEQGDRAIALIRELYSKPGPVVPWMCRKCDESNDESFELCWKCGVERE